MFGGTTFFGGWHLRVLTKSFSRFLFSSSLPFLSSSPRGPLLPFLFPRFPWSRLPVVLPPSFALCTGRVFSTLFVRHLTPVSHAFCLFPFLSCLFPRSPEFLSYVFFSTVSLSLGRVARLVFRVFVAALVLRFRCLASPLIGCFGFLFRVFAFFLRYLFSLEPAKFPGSLTSGFRPFSVSRCGSIESCLF